MVYEPVFADVEPWLRGYVARQWWRVEHLMQEEDMVQEARLQFLRMQQRNRRNGVVYESRTHFVNAFRVAFVRHVHTLSNRDSRYADSFTLTCDLDPTTDDASGFLTAVGGDDDRMMLLEVDLLLAPNEEVYRVLQLLFNPAPRVRGVVSRALSVGGSAGNSAVCALLGYDPRQRDVLGEVRQFLTERGEGR